MKTNIYKIKLSENTRSEGHLCSNQMEVFLESTTLYEYKWILPNVLKVGVILGYRVY